MAKNRNMGQMKRTARSCSSSCRGPTPAWPGEASRGGQKGALARWRIGCLFSCVPQVVVCFPPFFLFFFNEFVFQFFFSMGLSFLGGSRKEARWFGFQAWFVLVLLLGATFGFGFKGKPQDLRDGHPSLGLMRGGSLIGGILVA